MKIYVALNILIMYLGDVMKNKHQRTTILAALAYLLDRQNLSQDQLRDLIIKTMNETEQQ